MSLEWNEWVELEAKAGVAMALGMIPDAQNPVHLGVRLGTTVGRVAAEIFKTQGWLKADAFLRAMVAVCNQETVQVDSTQSLDLKFPCS